ncbi:DUF4365 domain-containing protein [Melaminivora sp.]
MKPLSAQNIESELSYAYLHAVAAHAGAGCKVGSRHDDSAGIDAELTGWGPFDNGGYLQEVNINVQLKATIKPPSIAHDNLSYSFSGIQQYNDLRTDTVAIPRILVVLFLPAEQEKWLEHRNDALTLRNCAYWVSLRGAPASDNQSSQTIYLPKHQTFDPDGLKNLMARLSRLDIPLYTQATA